MNNVINITEAAKEKAVARSTIYEWIKKGLINTEEILGKPVIVRDDKFESLIPARWSRMENTNLDIIQNQIKQEVQKSINRMNQEKIVWAINQMEEIKGLKLPPIKVGQQFYEAVFKVLLIGQEKPSEIKRCILGEHGLISMDNGSITFYDHISKIEFSHFLNSH